MSNLRRVFACFFVSLLYCSVSRALVCETSRSPLKVAYTLTVDKSGKGNFTTIQSAVDHIPANNSQWIRIRISSGVYREKVAIDKGKSCIFLDGAGSKFTTIVWDDHKNTKQSATFTSYSDNIVAKGITFENTYNGPFSTEGSTVTQAVAAAVLGDKAAFYYCSFVGVQDTLWDACGRHLFHQCFIQGGIDFIFGNGQSLYEGSEINYSMGPYSSEHGVGSITAEGRELANDPSGFVFTNCSFKGNGKAYLGRAWRNFSRVIVANSILSDVIVPEGWNAWNAEHHVEQLTYVEANCIGPGADTSKRVPWMKKLSATELSHFVSTLFIDQEGWLSQVAKLTNLQSFD